MKFDLKIFWDKDSGSAKMSFKESALKTHKRSSRSPVLTVSSKAIVIEPSSRYLKFIFFDSALDLISSTVSPFGVTLNVSKKTSLSWECPALLSPENYIFFYKYSNAYENLY